MVLVEQCRSEKPYIVVVKRRPTLDGQWVLALPTGATLTAPIRFDDDGDPVFSLPKAELMVHSYSHSPTKYVPLRDCFRQ
jgi:hypothetical protein